MCLHQMRSAAGWMALATSGDAKRIESGEAASAAGTLER